MPVSANGTLQTYSISTRVQLRYTGFLLLFTHFLLILFGLQILAYNFYAYSTWIVVHLDTRLTDLLSN
jgi:hypothetical protein